MNIDHTNYNKSAYKACAFLLLFGITVAVFYWFFSSFFLLIISALLFAICISCLCAFFAFGTKYILVNKISFFEYGKASAMLFATGYLGIRIMFFADDFTAQAKYILINKTGKNIDRILIKGADHGEIESGSWKFSIINLYGSCDVPIEYYQNGKSKNIKTRGCNEMLIGEFKIIELQSDPNIIKYQKPSAR